MIDKLKFLIDSSEDSPKLKSLLLKIAEMPEHMQDAALQVIEILAELPEHMQDAALQVMEILVKK